METVNNENLTLVVEHLVHISHTPPGSGEKTEGPAPQKLIIRGEIILDKDKFEEFIKKILRQKGIKDHTQSIPTETYSFDRATVTLIHE